MTTRSSEEYPPRVSRIVSRRMNRSFSRTTLRTSSNAVAESAYVPSEKSGLAFVLRIVRSARPRSAPGSAETPAAAKSASAQSAETRRESARDARDRARDRRAIARDRCAAPDGGRRPSQPRGLS